MRVSSTYMFFEPAYSHTRTSAIAQQVIVWSATCHNGNFVAANHNYLLHAHTHVSQHGGKTAQYFWAVSSSTTSRFKRIQYKQLYAGVSMCVICGTMLVLSCFAIVLWQTRKFSGFVVCRNISLTYIHVHKKLACVGGKYLRKINLHKFVANGQKAEIYLRCAHLLKQKLNSQACGSNKI